MNACSAPLVALFYFTAWLATTALADVTLPQVFGNHMVVQANAPLPIWGDADPGEQVVVRFAGQAHTAVANDAGCWQVTLAELQPNATPQQIQIEADNKIVFSDVLIGEVWICAGQSNMEWTLKQADHAEQAIRRAEQRNVRLLNLRGAARGGSGLYTAEHLSRLTPARFCRGNWTACSAAAARDFSAVGFFFGQELHAKLDVPIGLISPAIGGTPAEAWIRREALANDSNLAPLVEGNWLENPHLDQWCKRRASANFRRAVQAGEEIPGDDLGPNHSFKVGFMWDAGVAPLIPYAIRGVIWYQGESNAESARRARQHRNVFPRLVHDWRQQWRQGDFPFYYVQLPALGRSNWPLFREGQRRFLDQLPNVGMAVTMDVGHPANVHPTNKQPVGERLARLALAKTYGFDLLPTGPLLREWDFDGDQATIRFEHAGDALATTDGLPPRGFEAAGQDGGFHQARAKIATADGAGDSIALVCDDCDSIEHVRYGWTPYPDPPLNLVNSDQLPASPFTTESLD